MLLAVVLGEVGHWVVGHLGVGGVSCRLVVVGECDSCKAVVVGCMVVARIWVVQSWSSGVVQSWQGGKGCRERPETVTASMSEDRSVGLE